MIGRSRLSDGYLGSTEGADVSGVVRTEGSADHGRTREIRLESGPAEPDRARGRRVAMPRESRIGARNHAMSAEITDGPEGRGCRPSVTDDRPLFGSVADAYLLPFVW